MIVQKMIYKIFTMKLTHNLIMPKNSRPQVRMKGEGRVRYRQQHKTVSNFYDMNQKLTDDNLQNENFRT